MKKILLWSVLGLGGLFLLVQLIPYGRAHANPAVLAEPTWDTPQTKTLFARACADCHSNQTVWPWYSNVAPVSWLVQHDVEEGRTKLNLSEWGRGEQETDELADVVREGAMPPPSYLLIHPDARFSSQQKEALVAGLVTSLGSAREDRGNLVQTWAALERVSRMVDW